MKEFQYKAKKSPTEIIEGSIKAENKESALIKLSDSGLSPFYLKEKKNKKNAFAKFFGKGSISNKKMAYFTRSLADLIEGGLTVYEAINTIMKQTKDSSLKNLIESIKKDLKDGLPLSHSLMKRDNIFSPLFINLVKAGEASGTLEESCKRVADFYERKTALKGNILRSLSYPIFLIAIGFASISVIFTFVIPKLIPVFSEMGVNLPFITKIILKAGKLFKNYWKEAGISLALILLITEKLIKSEKGKIYFQKILFKIPIIKTIALKKDLAECFYSSGTLIQNGIPPYEAFEITAQTTSNPILKNELNGMLQEFKKGKNISDLMEKSPYFFPEAVNILKVGEKTGNLHKPLLKLSNKYEKEVEKTMNTFITFIEPILILIFGLILGIIIVAMLLPIFKLSFSVK